MLQLLHPSGPLLGGALDVVINNAGVGAPPGRGGKGTNTMFLQTELTTSADMIKVLTTNVAAPVAVTNALLPLLSRSDRPRVVNVSSARGSLAFGSGLEAERTGAMVYNASKAALNMVTLTGQESAQAHWCQSQGQCRFRQDTSRQRSTTLRGSGRWRRVRAVYVHLSTLPDDGPTGQLIGNHAPFSTDASFVPIPW